MRRHLLALITVAIFCAAFIFSQIEGETAAAAVCLRVGLVLGAIWLALPQLREMAGKVPVWMVVVGLAALFLVAFRPTAVVILLPIVIAVGITKFVKFLFKPLPPRRNHRSTKPAAPHPISEDRVSTKPTKPT